MAILTPSQLVSASNATYFDNVSGSITPASVRSLNTDWISSSILASQTSSLSVATASFALTSSFALNFNPGATASYATFAQNAGNATTADTATFANTAGAANSAISASHVDEAMVTASIAGSTLTFTKGDGTTFNLVISQTGSVASASYSAFAQTAATATTATSSISSSYAVSASSAVSSNTAISSSFASNANTATSASSALFANNATSASNAISASSALFANSAGSSTTATTASYALNADLLDNFSSTAFVFTSSFSAFSSSVSTRFGLAPTLAGDNTFTGNNIFGNVTASNALITSATVENLTVIYETSSIIYSSGSNQFGDAANDVQTLWGTVDVKTGPLLVSGAVNVSQSIEADQVNVVRAGFNSNPFNHQPSSYEGSIRYGADNQNFYITNYNQGTTAEAFTSQSNVGLFLNTGSNFVRTYLHADMSNVDGYLNLENANGNLNLNTNARFTVSASNTMFQGPAGAGVGTWFQNRVLISGPSAGETPKLFISGSDGAFTDLGRGNNIINTTVASGIDASSQIFANPAKEAAQYIGVFTPDTFVDDVEHAIRVDISGISFSDFDNGSAFDYVPYMTIAPNLGDNPAPVFTRGLVVTGSVNGNVVSASISSNTASLNFSQGNFFTSLVGSNTFFNITSPKAGQTVNLLLTTSGAATASFSSNVKQVSGSRYTPTAGTGKNDILTFISWDGTSVYLANVKNLV